MLANPAADYATPVPQKRAFSIAEFSAAYGIGRTKTYELLKTGKLRAVRCGDRTLIPHDAAEEWLRSLPTFRGAAA